MAFLLSMLANNPPQIGSGKYDSEKGEAAKTRSLQTMMVDEDGENESFLPADLIIK